MRSFIKMFFASILGFFVSTILVFLFFFLIIAGMVATLGKKEVVQVPQNTVLTLDLNYIIPERTSKNPLENFDFTTLKPSMAIGLDEIVENIRKAKNDDNVKGIYLKLGVMPSGLSVLEVVRDELEKFKASGKFIIAFGEIINQRAFFLGSVADNLYVNPVGIIELRGFQTQIMFFKNMFDKLEIEIQVFDAGKYKSASEPFRLSKMSDANREQLEAYIFNVYGNFIDQIATSRNISPEELERIASELEARTPHKARQLNLIDDLLYEDQVRDQIKSRLALDEDDELKLMSLSKYRNAPDTKKRSRANERIAILYAEGNIVDGEGAGDNIGSARFAKAIKEIREDDRIKALVVRVNSPGGSALASDVILRELELVGEKMPVIVSMGNVAASGGYYIATKADKIFAQPFTVTGSIGVFGLLPNMEGFFENKLGLTFDGIKTGKFTDLGNTTRPMNEAEKAIVQEAVDSIYMIFKHHVAEGRNFTMDYTESIAQGRIYSGTMALELDLVDSIGNIYHAIDYAAHVAGIEDYRLVSYPIEKDPFESLMKEFTGGVETRLLKRKLGEHYPHYQRLEEVLNYHPFQARMPFDIEIR